MNHARYDGRSTLAHDHAMLATAAQEASQLTRPRGLIGDEDDVFQAVHRIAARHDDLETPGQRLREIEATLRTTGTHASAVDAATARWTPEVVAAYYLGIAVGERRGTRGTPVTREHSRTQLPGMCCEGPEYGVRSYGEAGAFAFGDRVRFMSDTGQVVTGRVVKLNVKSVGLRTETGIYWRVSPRFLETVKA